MHNETPPPFGAIIYPNPAVERVNVELNNEDEKDVALEIFNLNGKLLHKRTLQKVNEIDASEWAEEVYLFRFIHNGITLETKKVR